jgi:UDP-2,3-diacylglucosamine pyrophosphatase LpxH
MYDAVVISDLHISSNISQTRQILHFLHKIYQNEIKTKSLIINGDLFDNLDFRRLKNGHWKVLAYIRKISNKTKVIYISGNHDGPANIISHILGANFVEEYTFFSGHNKVVILHGDRFDNFISKHPRLTKLADNIYRWIQRIDPSFYWARLLKRSSKIFLRCSNQIKDRAKQYAKSIGANIIICSHTHHALTDKSDMVHYINSGSWTENPCHYVLIKNGRAKLKEFESPITG